MDTLASIDDVRPRLTVETPSDDRILAVLEEVSALFRHEAGQDFTGEVPEAVRLRVAAISAKMLGIPEEARAGISQLSKTTGPTTDSVTFAGWALGGQVSLSPDDLRFARSYRKARYAMIKVVP